MVPSLDSEVSGAGFINETLQGFQASHEAGRQHYLDLHGGETQSSQSLGGNGKEEDGT